MKKILPILLSLMLCVMISGCGAPSASGNTEPEFIIAPDPTRTTAAAAEINDDPSDPEKAVEEEEKIEFRGELLSDVYDFLISSGYPDDQISYYDCEKGKNILTKRNWTVKYVEFDKFYKLQLGCVHSTTGLKAIGNGLAAVKDKISDWMTGIEKIGNAADTTDRFIRSIQTHPHE